METEVREQSTKDGFAITEMQFTAIVNMVARHETELNEIRKILYEDLYELRQAIKWRNENI